MPTLDRAFGSVPKYTSWLAAVRPGRQLRTPSTATPVAPVAGVGSEGLHGHVEEPDLTETGVAWHPPQLLRMFSLTYLASTPPNSTVVLWT